MKQGVRAGKSAAVTNTLRGSNSRLRRLGYREVLKADLDDPLLGLGPLLRRGELTATRPE
jgi:hypothetical protein